MRKITPLVLLAFLIAAFVPTLVHAQPAPTFTGLNIDYRGALGEEIFDTVTVDSIATITFGQILWFVEIGLCDTTAAETAYFRPNTSGTGFTNYVLSGTPFAVRLLGTHPNKFQIPMNYSWGPLQISSLVAWCWYGSSPANAGDSSLVIWYRGYTVPIGYIFD